MRFFVGVGAQEAGTTWLHDQLARHPQVAMPERKEVHYFDSVHPTRSGECFAHYYLNRVKDVGAKLRRGEAKRIDGRRLAKLTRILEVIVGGPDAYRELLLENARPETRVVGEITPAYSILDDEGFTAMREALDTPRLVFVMRDPLQRYWSAVRFAQQDPDRLAETFREHFRQPHVQARGDYAATLETLDRTFPPESVLHLFYEELFAEATLRRVAAHLGVDEVWDWDLATVSNASAPAVMPSPTIELLEELRPTYDFVRDRFGDRVPSSWASV